MIKAVCVDLDGTLVDSIPALYQVYDKFLAYYGKKGSKEEFNSLIGPSIDEIVAILKERYGLKPSVSELSQMYVSTIVMQGFGGTELFPGVKETIEAAKKKGIKLGIITSGTKALVKVCLEPLKILDAFDVIVTSEDVKTAKPNPEMYQIALKSLGVSPKDAIAIEDSEKGLEAAIGAGLKVIMFTHGKKGSEKLQGKVTYLSTWKEIGEVILA